ncbi:MAG: AtpZ/AtpI family protein [Bacteroidia bacterium]
MENNPQKSNNSKKNPPNAYIKFSAMGLQMGITIFAFAYGGVKLDEWLKLKFPIFTLVLSLAGVAGSLYYVIKELSKMK